MPFLVLSMANPSPIKGAPKCGHKSLATASNLANLLPTGTVLAFQALTPSFSNNGQCALANRYLTLFMIISCSVACFFSSFTDSLFCEDDKKLYYGIATPKGLFLLNDNDKYDDDVPSRDELAKYKLTWEDFVHAFGALLVFLVFAISDPNVQDCFFPTAGQNMKTLIVNLPLGAGFLGSCVFMLFPTKRRGIGVADIAPR